MRDEAIPSFWPILVQTPNTCHSIKNFKRFIYLNYIPNILINKVSVKPVFIVISQEFDRVMTLFFNNAKFYF